MLVSCVIVLDTKASSVTDINETMLSRRHHVTHYTVTDKFRNVTS